MNGEGGKTINEEHILEEKTLQQLHVEVTVYQRDEESQHSVPDYDIDTPILYDKYTKEKNQLKKISTGVLQKFIGYDLICQEPQLRVRPEHAPRPWHHRYTKGREDRLTTPSPHPCTTIDTLKGLLPSRLVSFVRVV